jgi:hypothetical protein
MRARSSHPRMKPQGCDRKLFDERDNDVAAFDVQQLVADDRALKVRSERIES